LALGAALLVAMFVAGSGAVLASMVAAFVTGGEGACLATVDGTREELAHRGLAAQPLVIAAMDRQEHYCRSGRMSWWGASLIGAQARTLADDGVFDRRDAEALARFERQILP
jgi:hypothetical protein